MSINITHAATPGSQLASGGYTGNGTIDGQTQTITGVGFTPKGIFIYDSSAASPFMSIKSDADAGAEAYSINAAGQYNTSDRIEFNSDGFVVTRQSSNAPNMNGSAYKWVAWG